MKKKENNGNQAFASMQCVDIANQPRPPKIKKLARQFQEHEKSPKNRGFWGRAVCFYIKTTIEQRINYRNMFVSCLISW